MIAADIRAEIDSRLDAIEAEHEVRIVFACESGSRAWGFASPDSDYDVRFIYLHRRDWYLSIGSERRRDVIETPLEGVWDINGWDLRKALHLFGKSNPPLLEWLSSPIVYRERWTVAQNMRELLPRCYSPRASMYHYRNMATRHFTKYLDQDQVALKKYFYALRPTLACEWIEAGRGAAPTEFEKLYKAAPLSNAVRSEVERLLEQKVAGGEASKGERLPALHAYLAQKFEQFERDPVDEEATRYDAAPLNALFRASLEEVWGADV